ncbi:MAG: UDP-N-acetylmuramoyl-tripeptide--D-alanyl-D-alanine ligase [Flavobacteriaceae bacterium]|nr:UDP-N-acetylmuramoyl-tripeptide--D-alanyl-D-alanine ligase [Flavobacteriaceae bacterium]
MDIKSIHNYFLQCKSVSIDTRKIEPDSLFVAIKGENFDANTFANEALEKGAKFVIIDNPSFFVDHRTLVVEDSLKTLQELAKFHREFLKIPIIALTGSNGKTTTKELIHVVLSKKYNTKATLGNLNNHIGVPLTLLSFNKETEIGIVEMGANHQKEIEFLCEIAKPDYGYITNFGKAHLEGFGGVEGVIKGKSEMYAYLRNNHKTVFVNLNDPIQVEKTLNINSFTFGLNTPANVTIQSIKANPFVEVQINNIKISSHLIGLYNSNNINAALAIGINFGVPLIDIKKAIEDFVPQNNRSQMLTMNSNEIILDAYNANPSSMVVALENFFQLENQNKIAILGDMFELGEESQSEHKSIVDLVVNKNSLKTYFIGSDFYENRIQSDKCNFYSCFEDFSKEFNGKEIKNTLLLIKGSRGMALERTLQLLS